MLSYLKIIIVILLYFIIISLCKYLFKPKILEKFQSLGAQECIKGIPSCSDGMICVDSPYDPMKAVCQPLIDHAGQEGRIQVTESSSSGLETAPSFGVPGTPSDWAPQWTPITEPVPSPSEEVKPVGLGDQISISQGVRTPSNTGVQTFAGQGLLTPPGRGEETHSGQVIQIPTGLGTQISVTESSQGESATVPSFRGPGTPSDWEPQWTPVTGPASSPSGEEKPAGLRGQTSIGQGVGPSLSRGVQTSSGQGVLTLPGRGAETLSGERAQISVTELSQGKSATAPSFGVPKTPSDWEPQWTPVTEPVPSPSGEEKPATGRGMQTTPSSGAETQSSQGLQTLAAQGAQIPKPLESETKLSPSPTDKAQQIPAPQIPAPQIPAPQIPAPQIPAPQIPAPQIPAPQIPAPQIPAPQIPALQAPTPIQSDTKLSSAEIAKQKRDEQSALDTENKLLNNRDKTSQKTHVSARIFTSKKFGNGGRRCYLRNGTKRCM